MGGATLVLGHGPHVLRAIEWRGNRLVAYSLGNLLTYGQTFFESKQPAFLGDYTWLTAHGRKVYGIWTEVSPAPERLEKDGRAPRPITAVRVGIADFSDSK